VTSPSLEFCLSLSSLTWPEFLWGLEKGILTWKDAIELATRRGQGKQLSLPQETKLSSLQKVDAGLVNDLVRQLAEAEGQDPKSVKEKWLYLLLAWIYEQRAATDDPLGEVERIYADFDYPSELESFVRYMPVTDKYNPKAHSATENHARLMSKWKAFLEDRRRRFSR